MPLTTEQLESASRLMEYGVPAEGMTDEDRRMMMVANFQSLLDAPLQTSGFLDDATEAAILTAVAIKTNPDKVQAIGRKAISDVTV